MENVELLQPGDPGKASGTTEIEAVAAFEQVHRETFAPKLATQLAQLIEAEEDEAELRSELPSQPGGEDFGSSHP
jgi:hypothetical protein